MYRLRRITSARPSASLIVSVIALIVSLTGTAFATGVLPSGSVGTTQIQDRAIVAQKIRARAVTRQKIRANAIDSSKVANHSLLAIDFKAGRLPAGPKGDTGAPGAAGTARAYAQVSGGVTPAFVSSATKSFTGVTHSATGIYCLTPAAGISPAASPAVVSTQSDPDLGSVPAGEFVVWQAASTGCAAGDYVVRTYRIYTEAMGGPALADDVSFSIIVA